MKVLALDPGAERMGFAMLEQEDKNKPSRIASGIFGLKREVNEKGKEPYQEYRLRLIKFWVETALDLLDKYQPDTVVSETVPAKGGGNFIAATQSGLASTAVTVLQTLAFERGLTIEQIAAQTVKRRIGGNGKATKGQVKKGVLKALDLDKRFFEAGTWDESDGIAIGLAYLGVSNGNS